MHTSVNVFTKSCLCHRLLFARLSAHSRYRAPNWRRVLNRRRASNQREGSTRKAVQEPFCFWTEMVANMMFVLHALVSAVSEHKLTCEHVDHRKFCGARILLIQYRKAARTIGFSNRKCVYECTNHSVSVWKWLHKTPLDQPSGESILSMSHDVAISTGRDLTVQYDFEKVEGALVDADSLPR